MLFRQAEALLAAFDERADLVTNILLHLFARRKGSPEFNLSD